jgi:hypothetical protein
MLQQEHRVEFDTAELPKMEDIELDERTRMARHLWQLLQHARLHGSVYGYTFAMFGLVHTDVEYIVGGEIAAKILGGKKAAPEDVISDQLMDLFTFQLNKGLEGIATKQEERAEARLAAEKTFKENMPKLRTQAAPY